MSGRLIFVGGLIIVIVVNIMIGMGRPCRGSRAVIVMGHVLLGRGGGTGSMKEVWRFATNPSLMLLERVCYLKHQMERKRQAIILYHAAYME